MFDVEMIYYGPPQKRPGVGISICSGPGQIGMAKKWLKKFFKGYNRQWIRCRRRWMQEKKNGKHFSV